MPRRNQLQIKPKFLKVLFCGSFKFIDEMKKIAQELEEENFKCFLPRFALGDFPSCKIVKMKNKRKIYGFKKEEFRKIIRVKKWFYDRLKDANILVIFDKEGYVGLSLAAEIGAAHILKKPTFFIKEPKDDGIGALLHFSDNFKIVPIKQLKKKLKDFNNAK